MSKPWIAFAIAAAALLLSALGVIYVKHQTRVLYSEVRGLQVQRDRLDRDWGRLQLQWSTLASHSRVEQLAHDQLHLSTPTQTHVMALR